MTCAQGFLRLLYGGWGGRSWSATGLVIGESSINLFQEFVGPQCSEIFGDDGKIHLQSDGAPPHYHCDIRAHLDAVFPDTWTRQMCAIEYPALCLDLTPMDFFLCGYLKDKVYRTKPRIIDALEFEIGRQCRHVACRLRKSQFALLALSGQ